MRNAFSLIEILIVVTIIAVLAAVAVPAYNAYSTKANMSEVYNYLQSLAKQSHTIYEQTGSWPTTINFGGTTVTINGATLPASCANNTPINGLPVCQIGYTSKTFSGNSNLVTMMIQAVLSPSLGFGSTNVFRLAVLIDKTKNQTTFPCGLWNGAANNMPSAYLPRSCTCMNMSDYQGGAALPTC